MPERSNSSSYGELKKPAIFAHRGASAYAPENTMAAFELAVSQGADAIELDAKLSADGYAVVMHDDTVNRTTDGSGSVKSLTRADLLSLDAGSKFPPLFKTERIPTLEQVLEAIGRKVLINIELTNYTTPKDDLAEKVVTLVKKFNLAEWVIFSSFSLIALVQVRKVLQEAFLGLLTYPGLAKATFLSRLVRFSPLLAMHSAYTDVTPDLVQYIHQAKAYLHVYTVNGPEEIKQLYAAGIDGIFTDDPLLALKIRERSSPIKL